jgi:undecaprenyl pyrophosphate phosphatase UppP
MPIRYLIAALVAVICAAIFGLAADGWSPWLQLAATVAGILLVGAIAFPRDFAPRQRH